MRSRRRDAGLSSVEVVIMATVMSVLMIMVTESMSTLSGVRNDQRTQFRLSDVSDQVVRRMEQEVDYATRVFCSSAEDTDYLRAMDLGTDLLAVGRRLPALTQHGFFEADGATPETGNVLFLARRGAKLLVKYETIADYHVQSLQFVVYAPMLEAGVLDLMRWSSDPMVDYWDVAEIVDPSARAEVLAQLFDNGVRFAWDGTSPRATGLWEVTAAGGLVPLPPDRLVSGREDPALSRSLSARHMQIAPNDGGGTIDVPSYAQASGAFPGGLEIKIDGSASGKLILLRLVTTSNLSQRRELASEVLRFLSTQG